MDLALCLLLMMLGAAVLFTTEGGWTLWLAVASVGPIVALVTGFTETEAKIFVAILDGIAQGMQK